VIISGGPEGIGYAMAAAVLLSERSTLITGSTMFVDGGMCLQVYS
jgi:enoyl-[acyl-carrier-protein] reductase (NADH)